MLVDGFLRAHVLLNDRPLDVTKIKITLAKEDRPVLPPARDERAWRDFYTRHHRISLRHFGRSHLRRKADRVRRSLVYYAGATANVRARGWSVPNLITELDVLCELLGERPRIPRSMRRG